jgi:hypothetical protein
MESKHFAIIIIIIRITDKLQKYTDLKEELTRNMATENGLYNITSTKQNGYYSKQIARKFKTV